MDRPEYVKCVRHTHADRRGETWCGEPVAGFAFEGIDHAAYEGLRGGRLLVCPECLERIEAALGGIPVFPVPPDTPTFSGDDVRSAEENP